jgi:predicted transcriptional regulator
MVAPSYSMKRQDLAKKIGLGRKPRVVEAEAEVEPKAGRTRRKAAAA